MIKLFSTHSKDIIINEKSNLKTIKKGGPAYFIENVLKENNLPHKIFTEKTITIEISVSKNGETGKILNKISSQKIKDIKASDIVIISTIKNEWVIDSPLPEKTKIFLDIQGYARISDSDFCQLPFWNNIFCLKGTKKEIALLPKLIIAQQKKKLLIITNGDKDLIIYYQTKKFRFKIKKVKSKDTIGAGDTFFANFIIMFLKSEGSISKSAKTAILKTRKFLLDKNSI